MPPMRAKLGRVAALVTVTAAMAITFATAADASSPPAPLDESTTTTAVPTTTVAPLVIDQPSVTPRRGTQLQVTPTVPPPVTATTLPPTALPANSGTGLAA